MMPPPHPSRVAQHSMLAVAAFIVGLLGFLGGFFPFVGFVGTVGLVLGIVDLLHKDPGRPRRRTYAVMGVVFGGLSTAGALIWVVAAVSVGQAAKKGSCPHLYAFDGETYQLDADLASGALYKAAERDDLDRLESLRPVGGEYRLRLQNDLQEIDHVDSLSLLVVDAPADLQVLPTQTGRLVGIRGAVAPLSTSRIRASELREAWTFEFERPKGERVYLVLRGRNTAFAEEAFVQYMATMGQGVRPLLELHGDAKPNCACHQQYLNAEIERLGLPLWISVSTPGSARLSHTLQPVGPAVPRSQALPIVLPEGGDRVTLRLEATPRFWEIDQVELASGVDTELDIRVLAPRGPGALAADDQQRVVLQPGERVDVLFDAPPEPRSGWSRTVVAKLRGYYDLDIGGTRGVNGAQIVAHRLGWSSLPKFAAGLESR